MLKEISTFIAVAQHGSFSGAGEALGLTQSAVSAQMQRLESALGTKLFDRNGRRICLNAGGERALPLLQKTLQTFEQAGKTQEQVPVGSVRIGVIETIDSSLLPACIANLNRRLPDVNIRITRGSSLHLLGMVDSGDLACAVVAKPPFPLVTSLHWHALWEEPFEVVVRASSSNLNWRSALGSLPYIRYDRTHDQTAFGGQRIDQLLRNRRIAAKEVCALDNLEMIQDLILRLDGVSVFPVRSKKDLERRDLLALPLGRPGFSRHIGLAVQSRIEHDSLYEAVKAAIGALTGKISSHQHHLGALSKSDVGR